MSPPPVATLVNRLAACPADFLTPPLVGGRGTVGVAAVVGDTLRFLASAPSDELSDAWLASLAPAEADDRVDNWLRACLVTCWLATDPSLAGLLTGPALLGFMSEELHRLAGLVRAGLLVRDDDRREELARLLLRRAGLVPDGETPEQAADRLATLDSITRTRVEAEARAAEERSRQVRAALERQRAAEEAAARATRE